MPYKVTTQTQRIHVHPPACSLQTLSLLVNYSNEAVGSWESLPVVLIEHLCFQASPRWRKAFRVYAECTHQWSLFSPSALPMCVCASRHGDDLIVTPFAQVIFWNSNDPNHHMMVGHVLYSASLKVQSKLLTPQCSIMLYNLCFLQIILSLSLKIKTNLHICHIVKE